MIEKAGGTRAILAYMLMAGFIAACFLNISDARFTALGTMATTGVVFYFSNKATLDQATTNMPATTTTTTETTAQATEQATV